MIDTKNLKVIIAIWSGISQLSKYLHYMHIRLLLIYVGLITLITNLSM